MARTHGRDHLTTWEKGVGRIHLDDYTLWIGDVEFDIDELRTYALADKLKDALCQLNPPPTAAECLYLSRLASGGTGWIFREVTDLLLELVTVPPRSTRLQLQEGKFYLAGQLTDYDELRTANFVEQVMPAIQQLNPPLTALELIEMLILFRVQDNYPGVYSGFLASVYRHLAGEDGHVQVGEAGRTGEPSGGHRGGDLPDRGPAPA